MTTIRPATSPKKNRRPPAAKRAAKGNGKGSPLDPVRPTDAGDTAPILEARAIESYASEQAGAAADEVTAGAIRDLLEGVNAGDAVRILRSVLEQHRGLDKLARRQADRELADNWQEGGYPYKNLLSR